MVRRAHARRQSAERGTSTAPARSLSPWHQHKVAKRFRWDTWTLGSCCKTARGKGHSSNCVEKMAYSASAWTSSSWRPPPRVRALARRVTGGIALRELPNVPRRPRGGESRTREGSEHLDGTATRGFLLFLQEGRALRTWRNMSTNRNVDFQVSRETKGARTWGV